MQNMFSKLTLKHNGPAAGKVHGTSELKSQCLALSPAVG
jgi:hypothetical protein